jgi:hypothetical protein
MKFFKGVAENVSLMLNSIKNINGQVFVSSHYEYADESSNYVGCTLKLLNGFVFFEANITEKTMLIILKSPVDSKNIKKFVEYFISSYRPKAVKQVTVPLGNKKVGSKPASKVIYQAENEIEKKENSNSE